MHEACLAGSIPAPSSEIARPALPGIIAKCSQDLALFAMLNPRNRSDMRERTNGGNESLQYAMWEAA